MNKKPINSVSSADEARQLAIEWQQWQSTQSLSLYEIWDWQNYFEKLADRFPELVDEFRENGIA